ncbi:MAG: fatty acid desaturase [Gammaproteobacteria bacterium]
MNYVHRNDLISAEQLGALVERSNWRGAMHLFGHVSLLAATGVALHLWWGSVWCVALFLLHGGVLNWLYAAQHEMMHQTAFRSRMLNEIGSRITGLIVLFPRDLDRIAHFRHHRYTNDPLRDPELNDVRPDAAPPSAAAIAWRLCGVMYWGRRMRYLLLLSVGDTRLVVFMTQPEQRVVVHEARLHVVVYLALYSGAWLAQSWAPLLYWLGPLLAARCTHEIQNLVEHTGCAPGADVMRNSRVIRTNPLMRWLGWNMQYHCHHHLFAAVPFYHLPVLNGMLTSPTRSAKVPLPEPVSYWQAICSIVRGPARVG